MIRPGWKRDVCPQCHMPGRISERLDPGVGLRTMTMRFHQAVPSFEIHADFCDNCGVMYAFEAVEKEPLVVESAPLPRKPERLTPETSCGFCGVEEGALHAPGCLIYSRLRQLRYKCGCETSVDGTLYFQKIGGCDIPRSEHYRPTGQFSPRTERGT